MTCYSVDGDAGVAVEARIRIGCNKFRQLVPLQKDCQARNLNKEDAVDCGSMEEADKDWMMIRMVGG